MPPLKSHQSAQVTKLLLLGDSGAGKSGALASLADAGFNVRILDLDNGIDVLANILKDPKSGYKKEALDRVSYVTLTDQMQPIAGKLVPKKATVWQKAIKMLDHWKIEEKQADGSSKIVEDFGPLITWGPQDVIVIDSLSFLSNAAMNFVLSMNARLGQKPHQSDWYDGQLMVEGLLQMLYDENVNTNVIVIAHVAYIGEDNGPQKGYPSTCGKALSPKIGRYFNTTLMLKATGSGAAVKQKLLTNSTAMVELKTSAPNKVKPEYDIKFGLAEVFKDLRG